MKALITGITGQDGSYLAELLLSLGYEVHGTIRRSSHPNTKRIDHIFDRLHLHYADVTDALSTSRLIALIRPDECYNLAAQSHVATSFELPAYTLDTIVQGTVNILEAIRQHSPETRFYQASSSEMFGNQPPPQSELTPMTPCSPYGAAKLCAHNLVKVYRTAYGLHASCGILFNHESPRRGVNFVTAKVCNYVKSGMQGVLKLGNISSIRDWGHARDYVMAMHMMLSRPLPDDFVIATGKPHSVADLLNLAFDGPHWSYHVQFDERLFRPYELDCLIGDATKARIELGWTPMISFQDLIKEMLS